MAERKTVDESQGLKDVQDYKRIVTSQHAQLDYQQTGPQVEPSKTKAGKQKHKEPSGRKRAEKKKVIESGDVEIREFMFNKMVEEATKLSKLHQSSAHSKPTIRSLTEDSKRSDPASDKTLPQHPVSYSTIEALINRNASSGGKVHVQNAAEDAPNERPFTTKAESLSRELSPSRFTAQMQSVLSESYKPAAQTQAPTTDSFRQNLLHSALTGMLNQSPGRVSPTTTKTPVKVKGRGMSSTRLPPKKEIVPGGFREYDKKSPPEHIVRTAKLPPEMNQQRTIGRSSPKFVSEKVQGHIGLLKQDTAVASVPSLHGGTVNVSISQTHEHHHPPPLYTSAHAASTISHSFQQGSHMSKLGMVTPTPAIPSSRIAPGVHIVAAPSEGVQAVNIPHHLQKVIVPVSVDRSKAHSPSREMMSEQFEAERRYSPHTIIRRTPPPVPPSGWIPSSVSPIQHHKTRAVHQVPSPQGPHRIPSPHGSHGDQSPHGGQGYMSPHNSQRGPSPYIVHREPVHQDRSSPLRDTKESHVIYRLEQPVSQSSPNQPLRDQTSPLSAGFRPQGAAMQSHKGVDRASPDHQVRYETAVIPPPAHIAYIQKPSDKGMSRNEQSMAVDLTKVQKYTIAPDRTMHNPLPVPAYVEGLMALSGQVPHSVTSGKVDVSAGIDHAAYTSTNRDSFHPVTKDILKRQQAQSLPYYSETVTCALPTISVEHHSPVSEMAFTQSVSTHSVSTQSISKHHAPTHTVPTLPVSMPSKGPLPPNVNPFTFTVKPPDNSNSLFPKEHPQMNAGSRLSSPGEMPKLVPEVSLCDRKYSECNHVDETSNDLLPLGNPFNMRLQNLASFPAAYPCKTGYRAQSVAVLRAKTCSITSAAKSLDLLRQNLQKCINKEIDQVIQSYMEKYFNPGIANIKLNNGPNAVSDDHVHSVCRQILEEAKRMYCIERRSITPIQDISDNVSESGSMNGRRSNSGSIRKRRPSDSNSEGGRNETVAPKKKRKGRPPLNQTGRGTPSKLIRAEPLRREGPKWEPERLTTESLFVMGARANKALGLGNTRGRLYIKHPDVFKYSGDQDDKAWLYERQLMPVTGGKAYMLLVDDIKELSETDEYRDSPNLMMDELKGFTVPEFMIQKMRMEMTALRTDSGRAKFQRSRSGTPVEVMSYRGHETDDHQQGLPFSSFSIPTSSVDVKSESRISPGGTEEIEFLSTADNDEQNGQDLSPLNMTSAFEDAGSPSATDLDSYDGDPQLPDSFTFSK